MQAGFDILEGNESVDLNASIMTIKKPGSVRILARQNGDSNWFAAEPLPLGPLARAPGKAFRKIDRIAALYGVFDIPLAKVCAPYL